MNTRKNQIVSAQSDTCDWIWKTKFSTWLSDGSSTIFWIQGKPGSGKSTLMKHLSSSTKVRQRLSMIEDQKWITLDFFFDFRLANEIGNSVEGLLRTLLHQIVGCLRKASPEFQIDLSIVTGAPIDKLAEMYKKLLHTRNLAFLILVDGLDEFTGNMRLLIKFLLDLRDRNCVRLCLASRPEPMIRDLLKTAPGLKMSDHNSEGIRFYINDAIKEFQPHLNALKLQDLQKIMLKRAEGVFLWIYFAVEELLQACVTGATEAEVREQLDLLAVEVQELYQRIVDRIPTRRREEAAILYTLISTANFQLPLRLLQEAVGLIRREEESLARYCPEVEDIDRFSDRLLATMGGLIEITREMDREGVTLVCVRLIHETVRSFTLQSQWCVNLLPSHFGDVFPDDVWLRLYSRVLLLARNEDLHSSRFPSCSCGYSLTRQQFVALLEERDASWQRVAFLLHRAITQIPDLCSKTLDKPSTDELHKSLATTLRCRVSSMHFALIRSHHCPCPLILDIHDLLMAASHQQYQYLQINDHRIEVDLNDEHRDHIVAVLFNASRGPLNYLCTTPPGKAQNLTVQDIVDIVLCHNERYTAFHVAVYLLLGYATMPKYFEKLKQQHLDLNAYAWTSLLAPRFPVRTWLPFEGLLETWGMAHTYGWPQQDFNPEDHLKQLCSLGLHIRFPYPESEKTIAHRLLEHYLRVVSRFPRMSEGCLKRLQILKYHGADFYVSDRSGSSLVTICVELEFQWKMRNPRALVGPEVEHFLDEVSKIALQDLP